MERDRFDERFRHCCRASQSTIARSSAAQTPGGRPVCRARCASAALTRHFRLHTRCGHGTGVTRIGGGCRTNHGRWFQLTTGPKAGASEAPLPASDRSVRLICLNRRQYPITNNFRCARFVRQPRDKRSDAAQASGSRVSPLSLLLVEHCERRDRNGYKGGVRRAVVRRLLCHDPRSRGWLLLTQDPVVVIGSPHVAVTVTLIAVLVLSRRTPARG